MIFIFLVAGALYFGNIASEGDLGRIICGIFPREMEALGLKKYLERYSERQIADSHSSHQNNEL